MDSALPHTGRAAPLGEQAASASTSTPAAALPVPSDAAEGLSVTAQIGDVAYVTTLERPTRFWRVVDAIFASDPRLTQIVVVRPSQIGGSYLIRREERVGAPPPR
ncbi:hypothetical protein [Sphingomonas sp. BK235]|uniref:hypothetical protein n=1 Tax=Sphingomonas sp. BK235 TaxID=2512131 RepID=UPI0010E18C3D|nr:hypothetical protein [Sphingomonas sp. BK235]TCP33718.1 hypothetical protein EV292_105168 [Sphingomonas sp. BK235]